MIPSHIPRSANRSTLAEALIVVSVVAGFFVSFLQGQLSSMEDIWTFIIFLVVIVIFYMCLLFCRMLFFWMTGGEMGMNHQLEEKRKVKTV